MVYRYGLLAPTVNGDIVREQMRLAHRYRNTLTEIERGRRAAIRASDAQHGDIGVLEHAAREARARAADAARIVKANKAAHRTTKIPREMRDALDAARVAQRDSVAALREARRTIAGDHATQVDRDEINDRAAELIRSARAHCGVYWGTYLLVEDEAKASGKQPLYDGADPSDPRFVRWSGEGTVGVQLQGGMSADALGSDTRLQIVARADRKTGRRAGQARTLRLRVQSDGRDPVWAEWPMVMHRPLPDGAVIKRATVHVRRIGPREEWSVTITISTTRERVAAQRCGAVALDLGWRVTPDGIRVGSWRGEDSATGEILIDARSVSGLELPEKLRSTRDDNFNVARSALVQWLAHTEVPEWLRDATETLVQWRSAGRLAALARRWRTNRFDGDGEAYEALERWRYRDHHLWEWETSQRTGALRRRREIYRTAAASLASRYDLIVLEKFDLRKMARRPAPDAPRENEGARSNRQMVAPSELRAALVNAFRGDVVELDGAYTTVTCHACGAVERFDAGQHVWHACRSCGAVWDQDANAAINLIERWRDGGSPGPARKAELPEKEGRWDRAKRMLADKQARKDGARKPVDNAAE